MSEKLPSFVEIGDSVLFQKIQDEVVLLNMENQQYYGLNAVGADMWESLIRERSLARAAEELAGIYEIDRETVRGDLSALVRDLVAKGLLKAVVE